MHKLRRWMGGDAGGRIAHDHNLVASSQRTPIPAAWKHRAKQRAITSRNQRPVRAPTIWSDRFSCSIQAGLGTKTIVVAGCHGCGGTPSSHLADECGVRTALDSAVPPSRQRRRFIRFWSISARMPDRPYHWRCLTVSLEHIHTTKGEAAACSELGRASMSVSPYRTPALA